MQQRRNRQGLAVATIVDAGRTRAKTFPTRSGCSWDLPRWSAGRGNCATSTGWWRRWRPRTGFIAVGGSASRSLAWLVAAWAARHFLPSRKIYHFYRKETPLVGGVLTSTSTALGRRSTRQKLLEYIRVSPTGPLVPLVLAVTTLGRRLHLSMTFRPALLSDQAAEELAGRAGAAGVFEKGGDALQRARRSETLQALNRYVVRFRTQPEPLPMAKRDPSPPAMASSTIRSSPRPSTPREATIVCDLFAKDAPNTVNNFVFLAREKFYDGTNSIASSPTS